MSPTGLVIVLVFLWFPLTAVVTADTPATEGAVLRVDSLNTADDTPDVETETTLDSTASEKLDITGDVRPIFDYFNLEGRDGVSESEDSLGVRLRIRADIALTDKLHFGTRAAGICFVDGCDAQVTFQSASDGIEGGTLTLDELFLHWSPIDRGSIALGRLQTRFVLRGGVYAKSLDRNDSNNVNITWTDGLQAIYRPAGGWHTSFILQRNSSEGTGSIRRDPLSFDDSDAQLTYFVGVENNQPWGHLVQRAFDVSYLPASLLKDDDPSGRREDYWGVVGRLAFRWPQRSKGMRLRAGVEAGYAPNTQTRQAAQLDTDVSGLAWNVVFSLMDFQPGHSVGINYGQASAGWLLSPQFRPNEELFEIRYQWRPRPKGHSFRRPPIVEPRIRWREDLEQLVGSAQKRKVYDMYLRFTWEF